MSGLSCGVVIATKDRPDALRRAIFSLTKQTASLCELHIVDDSKEEDSRKVVQHFQRILEEAGSIVAWHRGPGRGLTAARNSAISLVSSDIIMFLDDDVELEPTYLEEVLAAFHKDNSVLGVQGLIQPPVLRNKARLLNYYYKFFRMFHYTKRDCKVFLSTGNSYPLAPARPVLSQWLSGCNQSYRREVFEHSSFDENLKKYGFKEDLDFSYRLHRKSMGKLVLVPGARLLHHHDPNARIDDQTATRMAVAHAYYLRCKWNFGVRGEFAAAWHRLGEELLLIAASLIGRKEQRAKHLSRWRTLRRAYADVNKAKMSIRKGDFNAIY